MWLLPETDEAAEEKPFEGSVNRGMSFVTLWNLVSLYVNFICWHYTLYAVTFIFRCSACKSCNREEAVTNQSVGRKWKVKSREQVRTCTTCLNICACLIFYVELVTITMEINQTNMWKVSYIVMSLSTIKEGRKKAKKLCMWRKYH